MKSIRGYDRLAPVYWLLERPVFGRDLQRAREALIDELPASERILILGDGDGRLLTRMVKTFPNAKITSVDQSPRMIAMQQQRVASPENDARVEFQCVDARSWKGSSEFYDGMVAAFFLDCFTESELHLHLPSWLGRVKADGWFYHVDFVIPENGWRRRRALFWSRIMHGFFGWQTGLQSRHLVDIERWMPGEQWQISQTKFFNRGFLRSRVYRRVGGPVDKG